MNETLDQVFEVVTETATVEDSLVALLNGIKKQLKDALANQGTPAENQAKIDAIFQKAVANKQKLADVVLENTPNEEPGPASSPA